MSRRGHHGRHVHHAGPRPARPASPAPERPAATAEGRPRAEPSFAPAPTPVAPADAVAPAVLATPAPEPSAPPVAAPVATASATSVPLEFHEANGHVPLDGHHDGAPRTSCTTAQLRRFIKSRPWVPLHELRRRFGISGDDDDVNPVRVGEQRLFIGLPPAEARMIGELLSGGDIGYEISLDPTAPIVVGVYPMRPVPRT
jgi:hypothetical protein